MQNILREWLLAFAKTGWNYKSVAKLLIWYGETRMTMFYCQCHDFKVGQDLELTRWWMDSGMGNVNVFSPVDIISIFGRLFHLFLQEKLFDEDIHFVHWKCYTVKTRFWNTTWSTVKVFQNRVSILWSENKDYLAPIAS